MIVGQFLPGEAGGRATLDGWYVFTNAAYYLHNTNRGWTVVNAATNGYSDNRGHAMRQTPDWGDSDPSEMSAACNFNTAQLFLADTFGRRSYDGNGARATANVHEGQQYVNAYFDGVDFHFGDGDVTTAVSLVVLDVAAHEFAHAVDQQTAGLIYLDESGALNESWSDIFGALTEFFSQPDGRDLYPSNRPGYADWLIGEDCWRASTALRDMRDPGSLLPGHLMAGNQQPSRYQGTNWYAGTDDNGGVHVNSGVQNFFFYLLCEGGHGTNDGLVYQVTGLGLTNAAQVAYRTLTAYLSPFSDYASSRTAWLSAAADLQGDRDWTGVVDAAWAAVGVTEDTPHGGINSGAKPLDYTGDRRDDLALYDWVGGGWYVATVQGQYPLYGFTYGGYGLLPVPGDYDGDNVAELTVYDSVGGGWYRYSMAGSNVTWGLTFGGSGFIPVPGDYDGDGATDLAVVHQTEGLWYLYSLKKQKWIGGGVYGPWGGSGFQAVNADYDSDGVTDLAVYDRQNGLWYVWSLRQGVLIWAFQWGGAGYTPVRGDFDGDGFSDYAVYQDATGQWFVFLYAGYAMFYGDRWGGPGFVPVSGDYDGMGSTDLAVYSQWGDGSIPPGSWYIWMTDTGYGLSIVFGGGGLVPVGSLF